MHKSYLLNYVKHMLPEMLERNAPYTLSPKAWSEVIADYDTIVSERDAVLKLIESVRDVVELHEFPRKDILLLELNKVLAVAVIERLNGEQGG